MKKIISGKSYDTATALEIGSYIWRPGDRLWGYGEVLHRKKTGEYFLYCYGGPSSEYSQHVEHFNWTDTNEAIVPLSYGVAREWAAERLSGEEYEKIFGKVEEDDSKRYVTVSLTKTAIDRGKRAAGERGITFSALVDALLSGL